MIFRLYLKNYPLDLRFFEVSHILYKAYNDTGWWGFASDAPEEKKPMLANGISVTSNARYAELNIVGNYSFECKSEIYLKNDLNKMSRLKFLYILNYEDYFKIDKVISKCK